MKCVTFYILYSQFSCTRMVLPVWGIPRVTIGQLCLHYCCRPTWNPSPSGWSEGLFTPETNCHSSWIELTNFHWNVWMASCPLNSGRIPIRLRCGWPLRVQCNGFSAVRQVDTGDVLELEWTGGRWFGWAEDLSRIASTIQLGSDMETNSQMVRSCSRKTLLFPFLNGSPENNARTMSTCWTSRARALWCSEIWIDGHEAIF